MIWSEYRAWNRACMQHAWYATRGHFSAGWRSVLEALGLGVVATLAIYILGSGADSARDNLIAIGAGVAASLLWPVFVLCWNFNLAPFHLWREITSRVAVLEATAQQRADARAVADDLKACVIEGQRMAEQPDLFVKNLAAWYERCRTAVAQAGEAELAMYETFGQAPGTLVIQVAERQNVRDHIVKLRKIMARQYERAAELTAGQHPRRRR